MRVHELAKQSGMTSKEMIAEIRALGGEVKSHMSQVDDSIMEILSKSTEDDAKSTSTAKQTQTAEKTAKKKSTKAVAAKVASKPITIHEVRTNEAAIDNERAIQAKKNTMSEEKDGVLSLRFPIIVGNLATTLKMRVSELIKHLMDLGVFANINQLLNEEIVMALAEKLEIKIAKLPDEKEELLKGGVEDPSTLKLRPPVVTMMGHVDHGKTSLLDAIRNTNVAAKERGAITQHIGAYGVDIPNKGHVTFIDTPGHEAFTEMRSRGANVTDVVVLVVAADDGVMPQTIEAVNHAREAGCPIVVAINKSDLPGADANKVMLGLQKIDLVPEEWGGKAVCVKVSAKTGEGIDELLEILLLESEILELKADPGRPAMGSVIEGHLSKGSGPIATVIVQKGTLRVGEMVVCGAHMGRVRSMRNDLGKNVKEAKPSYSVEISGLNGVPGAGHQFFVVADDKTAKQITDKIVLEQRELHLQGAKKHLSLEDLYSKISEGSFKELKIIIKGDVQGSVEAIATSLEKLSTDQCQVRVIHRGVGGINESDVVLSAASDAIIIGFHVKPDGKAQLVADREGVDIRFYSIIYEAVEDVRNAMEGLLDPTYEEVVMGSAEVRTTFKSSKIGLIAGSMVIKGKIMRNNPVRLLRNNIVVAEGKLASLKRFKDDAREVAKGFECGFVIEGYSDAQEGDILESYRLEKVKTKL